MVKLPALVLQPVAASGPDAGRIFMAAIPGELVKTEEPDQPIAVLGKLVQVTGEAIELGGV